MAAYAPTNTLMGQKLLYFINFAPQHHYVLQAAIAGLHDWVRTGATAPDAPPVELSEGNPPQLILDANGIAMAGVRTPWVDVPIARTSGIGVEGSVLSILFGTGEPFDAATLARLYPGGAADYLERFTTSLDTAIRSGFLYRRTVWKSSSSPRPPIRAVNKRRCRESHTPTRPQQYKGGE